MKKIIFLLCLLFAGTATCFAQTETIRFTTTRTIKRGDLLTISTEPNTTIEISQGNTSIYTHTLSTSTLKINLREILEEYSSYKLYATQGKITGLTFSENTHSIYSLDASNCINLDTLILRGGYSSDDENKENVLHRLNMAGCTNLKKLDCYNNCLSTLDVSTCPALNTLSCGMNYLTELDVSSNTALEYLDCEDNNLTELNVSNNTALKRLYCSWNNLTELDVSHNTELNTLHCVGDYINQRDTLHNIPFTISGTLKHLNIKGCTKLKYLDCCANILEELDASGLENLTDLYISRTPRLLNLHPLSPSRYNIAYALKELNIDGCTSLEKIYCRGHSLKTLDASSCKSLQDLDCANGYEELHNLDLTGCTKLKKLDCSNNLISNDLNLMNCDSLQTIYCQNNKIGTLNIKNCTSLHNLECSNNQLTSLDVSGCSALTELLCYNNQLTTLDVSDCSALTELLCYSNQLTTLDVNACKGLTYLYCGNNQLTMLNVNGCKRLGLLNCLINQLTTLDLSGNPALRSVYCANNQIKDIDISQCLDLHCFYADSNALPLYEIYSVSQFYDEYLKPKDINLWHSITEQHIKLKVKAGSLVDLHREMSFASSSTKVKVFNEADDTPLFEDVDYRITEGFLRFEQDGRYKIQLRNVNVPTNCDFANGYSPFIGTNSPVTVYYHVAYGDVAPVDTCKEPVFSHEAGEVEKGTVVEISCSTEGAQIHYTTNGNTPTEDSPLYQDGITINKTTTIKAIAMQEDWADSKVVTVTYIVPMDTCQTPVFSHEAGEVEKGTVVEISCSTEGAQIHYTTNGNTPTEDSPLYQDGITINKTTTIKAIAIKNDWENSKVAAAQYTVPGSSSGDDTLAVSPRQPQMGLQVYPNPCNGILYIETGQNNEPSGEIRAFRILDLQGREQLCAPGSVRQMDMSPLPSGIYILEAIGTKGATIRHKIVRQ